MVQRAAFFDLEKTITRDAAEEAGAREFYRQKEIPLSVVLHAGWIYLQYNLGLIADFEKLKRSGARSLAGRDAARDRRIFEEHFHRTLKHAIYPEAIRRIEEFKRDGVAVHIVSSTYAWVADVYARHLGIESVFAVKCEEIDGKFTGRIVERIPHQENKAAVVEELARRDGIDLRESYAFGDSINDRAMLERVGHPVAVNPDRKLRAVATSRNWQVVRWTV